MNELNPSPVYHSASLRVCFAIPQGGEAQALLKPNIDLENCHHYQPASPLPTSSPCGIWEGRGERSLPKKKNRLMFLKEEKLLKVIRIEK